VAEVTLEKYIHAKNNTQENGYASFAVMFLVTFSKNKQSCVFSVAFG